jgi:undecaprenyl-diphosphatase
MNRFMAMITWLGDGWLWLLFALVAWFFDAGSEKVIYQMALAITMELATYKILKKICSRPRPFQCLERVTCIVNPPDRYSFPSGHTAAAFVVAGTVGVFYSALFLPLLLLAALIGFSRIYLGAHYPTDVLAGAFLGWSCAEIARWLLV